MFLLATIGLFSRTNALLSVADFTYPAAVAMLLLGRWTEFRTGLARTGTGEIATREDLRRYVLSVLVLALVIGGIAFICRTVS